MSLRRKSREFALQMIFQWEMSPQEVLQLEATFWKGARAAKATREFANRLFEAAVKDVAEADRLLERHAEHWRLERMPAIDRAILRLAITELRTTDTPANVVLNEAVELAKKYSTEDSASFVNGLLDAIHKSLATSH